MTRIRALSRWTPGDRRQKWEASLGRGKKRRVRCETQSFSWLAEHELRCAKRYRRFFTIVIGLPMGERGEPLPVLARGLRETDEIMLADSGLTILMTETDRIGAWVALRRLTERYGNIIGMRFGVASYPKDGRDIRALLGVARSRLEEA